LRRHVGRVDHVLEAHRHAGEQAFYSGAIDRARLRQRGIGIEMGPRLHFAFARAYALDAGGDQRFRSELAGSDAPGSLCCAEMIRGVRHREFVGRV
jgi:hypothetical protein